MHISKVELENFKSHADATFEFGRGTTSITGENGAGKTSIIEAVAWTIFDTLDYKKEDVVRRGSKKASARVTFESGLDERDYTVYRDTGNGYYVYDPRLKTRIADKKEEVTRFLWQHLGIEAGTDLELLFRHAIGVPQGTFTAIFLVPAAERKRTFDGLLKVEEYRRSSDELLKTARFVEQQIAESNVRIARAEGEIGRIGAVEREMASVAAGVKELSEQVKELNGKAAEVESSVARLDEIETRLNVLKTAAERARTETAKAELVMKHRESDLHRSSEAAERVASVRADAELHQNTLGRLKELERERSERQKLRDELARTEAALNAVSTERGHLQQELERLHRAKADIESLRKLADEQDTLESGLPAKRRELARAEEAAAHMQRVEERLAALRETYRSAADDLANAREKAVAAADLVTLQTRDAEIVRELAAATTALERDELFQKEISNGLCPIISAKCLNLNEGETLENFVSNQFTEQRTRIELLRSEHITITDALKLAREAALVGARASVLEKRLKEIGDEGTRLRSEKEKLEADSLGLGDAREAVRRIEEELRRLDNPKAKISLLEKDAARDGDVREKLALSEKNLERLQSDRQITIEKLESYKDLDALFVEASGIHERTAEPYRAFIANEQAAALVDDHRAAYDAAQTAHSAVSRDAAAADEKAKEAGADYDRELHNAQRAALLDLQRRQAEANARFEAAARRHAELTEESERLNEIRRSMQDEFRERERLQSVAETTDFIRSTLREAAPLVARNYVHHVSLEANQMFREILGDAESTLKWTDDYGIVLEHGGHDRPFQSLSGGEQMAAALAVRLALLKQLSDIHIAFFDEPTANMDAERRENLAQQIANISHFDQLFVISHDDTFEGYMDYEVSVGESLVA